MEQSDNLNLLGFEDSTDAGNDGMFQRKSQSFYPNCKFKSLKYYSTSIIAFSNLVI